MPKHVQYVGMKKEFFDQKFRQLTSHFLQHSDKSAQEILDQLPDEYLFKKKIYEYRMEDGKSFLHLAVQEKNLHLVDFLLLAGFNPNYLDFNYRTSLFYACDKLDLAMVKRLLAQQADPNVGFYENIPLVATIESKATVDGGTISAASGRDFSHFTKEQATEEAAVRIVKKLIEHHVDINLQTGEEHLSALHRAVALQKPLIVKELADHHADFTLLSADGMSALHMLVEYRSANEKQQTNAQIQMQKEKQIADIVIPHSGPVYKLKAEFGNTALHTAVIGSNPDVVEALCKNDYLFPQQKLLSITNDQGNSAIHEALLEAHRGPRVLNILLRLATETDLATVNARGESVRLMAERLTNEAQLTHNLVESTKIISDALEDFFVGKDIAGKDVADFEFTRFEEIINELRDTDHLDLNLPGVRKQLDDIHAELNEIKQKKWISIEQTEALHETIESLLAEINKRYPQSGYIETLKSVRAEDRLAWQQQQLCLPSHFSGLERAVNHEVELAAAHNEYNSALNLLEIGVISNGKTKLLNSIDHYIRLKEYNFLEKPFAVLARLSMNSVDTIKEYELNQKALLNTPTSSHNEQLKAHMALASLYQLLRKEGQFGAPLLSEITRENLFEKESFHFSEAYKFTQGPIDREAQVVLQRELGVSTDGTKLGTYNIQQCVTVIAHDPNTQKVVLSHFDRFSGPLKFIDQILAEFPDVNPQHKIDLYVTGGRDRSEVRNPQTNEPSGKEIADSNIEQVVKQIYHYQVFFNIRGMEVGDKLSPPAVVFDPLAADGQRLQQGMPDRADSSLASRAAAMSIELSNRNEYLQPIAKIDYSKDELSRKKTFSVAQLKTKYEESLHWFGDPRPNENGYPEAWKHNQILQPLIASINQANQQAARNTMSMQPMQPFAQELLLQDVNNYAQDLAVPLQQLMNLDVTSFRQQNNQPSMDLIEVLRQPPQAVASYQALSRHKSETLNELSETSAMTDDDQVWDEASPAKMMCLSQRPKRETAACLFSWEDVDEFNLEKQNPRDSEKIIIDSAVFLDSLNRANAAKRIQLLKLAADCQLTGEQTADVGKLLSIARLKTHFSKVEKISSVTMEVAFAWDALMSLNGDKSAAAQLLYFKLSQHLSEKMAKNFIEQAIKFSSVGKLWQTKLFAIGAPMVRGLPQIFNNLLIGDDLYENIKILLKDSANTRAWVRAFNDGTQLTVDLTELGVRALEMSSEAFAALEYSELVEPIGGTTVAIVMLGERIYEAVGKVDEEDHVLHLSAWHKVTEGTRAFLNRYSAYQKTLDEIKGYENILSQQSEFLAHHPEVRYIISPAIQEVGGFTRCVSVGFAGKGCRRKEYIPIFKKIEDNSGFFKARSNDFKYIQEEITPPAGTKLLCLPTTSIDGKLPPAEGAYQCNASIGLSNTNSTGNLVIVQFEKGKDSIEGFLNLPHVILVNEGKKEFRVGKQNDKFILQSTENVTGVLDGGEGSDELIVQGLQANAALSVNLVAGFLKSGIHILQLEHIEKISGGKNRPLNITVAGDTEEVQLLGFSKQGQQHTVSISNSSAPVSLKMYIQSSTHTINAAVSGNFTYYILPGNGTISFDLSAQENNDKVLNQQLVFNVLIDDLDSIQMSNVSDPKAAKTIKFHFKVNRLQKLLREIHSICLVKPIASNKVTINYHPEPNKAFNLAPTLPVELPSTEISNLIKRQEQRNAFHFNVTLTQQDELQSALTYLLNKVKSEYKEDFKFELMTRLSHPIDLSFINKAKLKIGNKYLYYFQNDLNQPVSEILNKYIRIASQLNLICILKTTENEQIMIGHTGRIAMQNNPEAFRTHFHANGGAALLSVKSAMSTLVLSHLPIPETVVHHSGEQVIVLSLQTLVKQMQASGWNYKLIFITPNLQNRLGNDLLLSLMVVSVTDKQRVEVATIRLSDAYPSHWYKKYLHILLAKSPLQIVGRDQHLQLTPVPVDFDVKSEIALIGVEQIEADTDLVIPLSVKSGVFLQHNATNLIWTELGYRDSNQRVPFTLIIKKFFQEPELQTLHLQFNDTKIALNLSQLPLLQNFNIEKNRFMIELNNQWRAILANSSYLASSKPTHVSTIAAGQNQDLSIINATSIKNHTNNFLMSQRHRKRRSIPNTTANKTDTETRLRPYQAKPSKVIAITIPISSLMSGLISGVCHEVSERNRQQYPKLPKIMFFGVKPTLLAMGSASMNLLLAGPAISLGLEDAWLCFAYYLGMNYLGLIMAQLGEKLTENLQNKLMEWIMPILLYTFFLNPSLLITLCSEGLSATVSLSSTLFAGGVFFKTGEWCAKQAIEKCFPANMVKSERQEYKNYQHKA